MGFTKIKNVTNMTSRWMWLQNGENLKFGLVMPPFGTVNPAVEYRHERSMVR